MYILGILFVWFFHVCGKGFCFIHGMFCEQLLTIGFGAVIRLIVFLSF